MASSLAYYFAVLLCAIYLINGSGAETSILEGEEGTCVANDSCKHDVLEEAQTAPDAVETGEEKSTGETQATPNKVEIDNSKSAGTEAEDASTKEKPSSTALVSYDSIYDFFGSLVYRALCGVSNIVIAQGERIASTVKNKTKEYIENIRKLLREEFGLYYGIESSLSAVATGVLEEGTILNTLYIYIWNVILFLHIIFMNYLFIYYIPLFIILGFNCAVILLLYIFNSEKIIRSFYSSIVYSSQILFHMFSEYPKVMCSLVLLFCVAVCLWYVYISWVLPIHAHCDRHHAKKHRKTVADSMIDLQNKIDNIDARLKKLDEYIRSKN